VCPLLKDGILSFDLKLRKVEAISVLEFPQKLHQFQSTFGALHRLLQKAGFTQICLSSRLKKEAGGFLIYHRSCSEKLLQERATSGLVF
jgi:hypothetical protein